MDGQSELVKVICDNTPLDMHDSETHGVEQSSASQKAASSVSNQSCQNSDSITLNYCTISLVCICGLCWNC